MSNTLTKLQNHLIKEYGNSKHDFTDSYLDLSDDLGLDSLDKVEFIQVYVYKEFGILINDYDFESIETLHQLANYIDDNKCTCFTSAQRKFCSKNCVE